MKLSAPIPVLKEQAKRLAKEQGITKTEALNSIARREGFSSWSILSARLAEFQAKELAEQIPAKIEELPLKGALRSEAVAIAKLSFANALRRMEARNPRKAKSDWNAGEYVDRILTEDMLPIETDYALHLVEAFIVMDAVEAAAAADGVD